MSTASGGVVPLSKPVTGHDVARLAGVSQATVSRALRNLPGTSPKARAAVLKAAEALAYVPSDSGRVLSTRRTGRVALVSEELTNPYYPELVGPIQQQLALAGLRTVLVTDARPACGAGAAPHGVSVADLADSSYDGVMLTTTLRTSSLPRDLTEAGIPHVLVNRVLDEPESPSCTVDNTDGIEQVARLLADLGHRRVASIQGPTSTSTARERAVSLRGALRAHDIPLPYRLIQRTSFDHEAGMRAAHTLLTEVPRPTAIVCGNDVLALGALSAARQLGLVIPEELTVIGFDDIAMASWPQISLTTVRCDLARLAQESVRLLVAEIREPSPLPTERRVPVELILRGTHGSAPN